MVRNVPAVRETWVPSLGWEDPLEKGMSTHSSIIAWEIPVTEEPGGLQSMGSQSDAPEQLTLWLFFFPLSSSIVGMCPSQSVRSPSPLFPLGVHVLIPCTGLTLRALTGRSREGSVIGERSTLRRCSISGLNSVSEGGSCSFPLVNRRAG